MLVLLDIDGTLLHGTTEPVARALAAALKEVHGVDVAAIRTQIETAGRTDGEIARAILLDASVPAQRADALAGRVQDSTARWSARLLPADLTPAVLPGVPELLEWLTEHADTQTAVLTGNYEPIARLKLRRAGLADVCAPGQGAFGSDAEDRLLLPPIARRHAGSPPAPYPREHTIIIGDTPRDIACARADGLRCIAVATGQFTRDELIKAGADAAANDAYELITILGETM